MSWIKSGAIGKIIFDPSSGGIGIKLNNINPKLTFTNNINTSPIKPELTFKAENNP